MGFGFPQLTVIGNVFLQQTIGKPRVAHHVRAAEIYTAGGNNLLFQKVGSVFRSAGLSQYRYNPVLDGNNRLYTSTSPITAAAAFRRPPLRRYSNVPSSATKRT